MNAEEEVAIEGDVRERIDMDQVNGMGGALRDLIGRKVRELLGRIA